MEVKGLEAETDQISKPDDFRQLKTDLDIMKSDIEIMRNEVAIIQDKYEDSMHMLKGDVKALEGDLDTKIDDLSTKLNLILDIMRKKDWGWSHNKKKKCALNPDQGERLVRQERS